MILGDGLSRTRYDNHKPTTCRNDATVNTLDAAGSLEVKKVCPTVEVKPSCSHRHHEPNPSPGGAFHHIELTKNTEEVKGSCSLTMDSRNEPTKDPIDRTNELNPLDKHNSGDNDHGYTMKGVVHVSRGKTHSRPENRGVVEVDPKKAGDRGHCSPILGVNVHKTPPKEANE